MAELRDIVVDCRHPATIARFWADVLDGYRMAPYDEAEIERLRAAGFDGPAEDPTVCVLGPPGAPRWWFVLVPEGKTTKNRVHWDITGSVADLLCPWGHDPRRAAGVDGDGRPGRQRVLRVSGDLRVNGRRVNGRRVDGRSRSPNRSHHWKGEQGQPPGQRPPTRRHWRRQTAAGPHRGDRRGTWLRRRIHSSIAAPRRCRRMSGSGTRRGASTIRYFAQLCPDGSTLVDMVDWYA